MTPCKNCKLRTEECRCEPTTQNIQKYLVEDAKKHEPVGHSINANGYCNLGCC